MKGYELKTNSEHVKSHKSGSYFFSSYFPSLSIHPSYVDAGSVFTRKLVLRRHGNGGLKFTIVAAETSGSLNVGQEVLAGSEIRLFKCVLLVYKS
jgi:hypothetical protein